MTRLDAGEAVWVAVLLILREKRLMVRKLRAIR